MCVFLKLTLPGSLHRAGTAGEVACHPCEGEPSVREASFRISRPRRRSRGGAGESTGLGFTGLLVPGAGDMEEISTSQQTCGHVQAGSGPRALPSQGAPGPVSVLSGGICEGTGGCSEQGSV